MRLNLTETCYPPYLTLGIQTTPDNVQQETLRKARVWAPRAAKSFTIDNFWHSDYHGRVVLESQSQGYATAVIAYFTTTKEGEHLVEE